MMATDELDWNAPPPCTTTEVRRVDTRTRHERSGWTWWRTRDSYVVCWGRSIRRPKIVCRAGTWKTPLALYNSGWINNTTPTKRSFHIERHPRSSLHALYTNKQWNYRPHIVKNSFDFWRLSRQTIQFVPIDINNYIFITKYGEAMAVLIVLLTYIAFHYWKMYSYLIQILITFSLNKVVNSKPRLGQNVK